MRFYLTNEIIIKRPRQKMRPFLAEAVGLGSLRSPRVCFANKEILCPFCLRKRRTIFESHLFNLNKKTRTRLMPRLCFWRKRWDSNPRAREGYLISSQARYDHFDTPPYSLLRPDIVSSSAGPCQPKPRLSLYNPGCIHYN